MQIWRIYSFINRNSRDIFLQFCNYYYIYDKFSEDIVSKKHCASFLHILQKEKKHVSGICAEKKSEAYEIQRYLGIL